MTRRFWNPRAITGRGRFTGPGRIEVNGRELRWRAALIATGSRPSLPPVPGLADADPLTNESVWGLRALPERLAVLGGGPIGVELGQAFSRLGSEVHIVEALPRLLPREESRGERFHCEHTRGRGHLGAPRCPRRSNRAWQTGKRPTHDRRGRQLRAGEHRLRPTLVATGRRPDTEDLGLETVGVELSESGGVKVNNRQAHLRRRGCGRSTSIHPRCRLSRPRGRRQLHVPGAEKGRARLG